MGFRWGEILPMAGSLEVLHHLCWSVIGCHPDELRSAPVLNTLTSLRLTYPPHRPHIPHRPHPHCHPLPQGHKPFASLVFGLWGVAQWRPLHQQAPQSQLPQVPVPLHQICFLVLISCPFLCALVLYTCSTVLLVLPQVVSLVERLERCRRSSVFYVWTNNFLVLHLEEQHVAGNSHLVLVQPVVLVVAQCSQISVWAEGLVQQSVHVDAESSKDHQIAAQGAKDLDLELWLLVHSW